MTESKIITELKNGSTEALCALIDKYTSYVSSIIFRIIGYRQEDCSELTADVFAALWNSREKLSGDRIKPYLGEIARNKAYNFVRDNKETLPLDEEIIFSGDSPENHAEKTEQAAILKSAMSKLDPGRKELLIRYYCYGQKIHEAARDMNIKSSTARVWLKRGRDELGKILRKEGFEL